MVAAALRAHQDAVQRLAEVPGFGPDSAQQVIAEVGPTAGSFPSPEQLSSWVGTCPGREESAEVSRNNRSPKGNRMMRRVLTQVANAAVKSKGSVFQNLYRKLVPRLGHNKAIWAIAHRLCRLTWKILHQGVRYIELGTDPNPRAVQKTGGQTASGTSQPRIPGTASAAVPCGAIITGGMEGGFSTVPPGFCPASAPPRRPVYDSRSLWRTAHAHRMDREAED